MTLLSNLHGRVLEYLITEEIIRTNSCINLTSRAIHDQSRDTTKSSNIDPLLLAELKHAANGIISRWLEPQFKLSQQSSVTLDRLPDQNQLDVTDIRLTLSSKTINLSIKHNHAALRHQRPGTTPVHCGFPKKSLEMQQFRQKYKVITHQFIRQAEQETLFSKLPSGLIEQHLYTPICDLVGQFINSHSSTCSTTLFQYLVGAFDYYKIIVNTRDRKFEIQDFSSLNLPSAVVPMVSKQYVYLHFNNAWRIKMRLHTASSQIRNSPSLKFDTSLVTPVSATILSYD